MKVKLALLAAAAVALVATASAAAFTPPNPYYAKQWYLAQDHAFDAWQAPPSLTPVKVALVDSGVDCSLPDLEGMIVAQRSFVGGSACMDTVGHGTIAAGEIAGALGSNGVVGLDWTAQLIVAKVVAPDGTIPLKAEAAAIRWAVNQGARVVNLSFGAVRDPLDPTLDSYSKREARAVAYAWARGALVVAAVGNSDQAPVTPWPYASWPAALPHVIGVAALSRSGNVPQFSDQDPRYVDLAAPGVDIFSTFPTALTGLQPDCTPQGYTACATGAYRHPQGTSFAAPQVSAAAAVLLGMNPALTNSQVETILERTANDVNKANGCPQCPIGHDKYSGWGRLDVAKAVAQATSNTLPPFDPFEPNGDIAQAHTLVGKARTITSTVDYYNDPLDVYRIQLPKGQELKAHAATNGTGKSIDLTIWPANAQTFTSNPTGKRGNKTVRSAVHRHLYVQARNPGWYYLEVRANPPRGRAFSLTPYTLTLTKLPAKNSRS